MGDSRKIMQVRSSRQVPVRVLLLDDELYEDSVDKRAVGWVLFDKVCEHLNLVEKDYFGFTYRDAAGLKFWINNDKKISKQLKGQNWDLTFELKFYSPEPSQLVEDITRYQLCLQIRRDIVNEKLPCSFLTYTLLGSYTAQSELGDYDTEEFGSGYKYLKDIKFAPHQDKELLQKIAELHRQHKGQTPEEAELHFLENAVRLSMYGVELHQAKDAEGTDISLGVCANGLIVYKDNVQMNRFVWPKVLKISYRRNKYYIKIRPGEFEEFASLIGFKLLNVKMAKRLWKISVEHHSFFRFREPDQPKSVGLMPRFGSRFRYSGRTQFQTRQIAATENRDSVSFDRVMSKRGTFAGRTQNMRKRDEDRQHRRDELRKPPVSPDPRSQPVNDRPPLDRKPEHQSPPEPKYPPPELKQAPPVAPKPSKPKASPRGPPSENTSLDRSFDRSFDSFEDVPDRRSKMEKMHAVPTPLAVVMQKSFDRDHSPHHSEDEDEDRHRPQVGKIAKPVKGRRYRSHSENRDTQGQGRVKSNNDRARNTDKYLFSYPSSSIDSILSKDFDEYDGDKRLDDCRTKSIDNVNRSSVNKRRVSDLSYRHSVEDVSISSQQPFRNSQYCKNEDIYADIDEINKQSKKNKDRALQESEVSDKDAKIIHGRKSKLFSSRNNKPSQLEDLKDVQSDLKTNVSLPQIPHEQTPKYAKISRTIPDHKPIKKEDTASSDKKSAIDEQTKSRNTSRADRNSSSSLREELKMYILSPEKLSLHSEPKLKSTDRDNEKQVSGISQKVPVMHSIQNNEESHVKTSDVVSDHGNADKHASESIVGPETSSSEQRQGNERETKYSDKVSEVGNTNKSEPLSTNAVKVSDLAGMNSESIDGFKSNYLDGGERQQDIVSRVGVSDDMVNYHIDGCQHNLNKKTDSMFVSDEKSDSMFVSGAELEFVKFDNSMEVNECEGRMTKETDIDGLEKSHVTRKSETIKSTVSHEVRSDKDCNEPIYENLPIRSKREETMKEDDLYSNSGSSRESLAVDAVKTSHMSAIIQGDISELSNVSSESLDPIAGLSKGMLDNEQIPGQDKCGSSSSLYQIVFDGSSLGSPEDQKDFCTSLTSVDINDLTQNNMIVIEDEDLEKFSNLSSDVDETEMEHQVTDSRKMDTQNVVQNSTTPSDLKTPEKTSEYDCQEWVSEICPAGPHIQNMSTHVDVPKENKTEQLKNNDQNTVQVREIQQQKQTSFKNPNSNTPSDIPKLENVSDLEKKTTKWKESVQESHNLIKSELDSSECLPRKRNLDNSFSDKSFLIETYEDEPFKRRSKHDSRKLGVNIPAKVDTTVDFFRNPGAVSDLPDTNRPSEKSEKEETKSTNADGKVTNVIPLFPEQKSHVEESPLENVGDNSFAKSSANMAECVLGNNKIKPLGVEQPLSARHADKKTSKDPFWYKTHLLPKDVDNKTLESSYRDLPDSKQELHEPKPDSTKEQNRNKPGSQASKAAVAVAATFHPRNRSRMDGETHDPHKELNIAVGKREAHKGRSEADESVSSAKLSTSSRVPLSKMKDIKTSNRIGNSTVPIIKDSKVFVKEISKMVNAPKQIPKEKNEPTGKNNENERILSGNLKIHKKQSNQSLNSSKLSQDSSDSYNEGMVSTTDTRKPRIIGKQKVSPGVIHIMNPCPSGWLEGGIEDVSKQNKVKSINDTSKTSALEDSTLFADRIQVDNTDQVSVIDFDNLQEVQTLQSDSDTPTYQSDGEKVKGVAEEESETNESTRVSSPEMQDISKEAQATDDSENILTTAPNIELLCRRVWTHSKRPRNAAEVSTADRNNKDFADAICRGPDEADYKYRFIGPSNSDEKDGTNSSKTCQKLSGITNKPDDSAEGDDMDIEGEDFMMIDASDPEIKVAEIGQGNQVKEDTDCEKDLTDVFCREPNDADYKYSLIGPSGCEKNGEINKSKTNLKSIDTTGKPCDTTEGGTLDIEGQEFMKIDASEHELKWVEHQMEEDIDCAEEVCTTNNSKGKIKFDKDLRSVTNCPSLQNEGNLKGTGNDTSTCIVRHDSLSQSVTETDPSSQTFEKQEKRDAMSVPVTVKHTSKQTVPSQSGHIDQSIDFNDKPLVVGDALDTRSKDDMFTLKREHSDSDTDSSGTHTDSDSSQEIELASFEMPQHITQLDDSEEFVDDVAFVGRDVRQMGATWGRNYQNVNRNKDFEDCFGDVTAVAIDCSFENVESYKIVKKNEDNINEAKSPILCECNFDNSAIKGQHVEGELYDNETAQLYDNYYCVEEFYDPHSYRVPEVIDDTPFKPIRSVLKCKFKSESCLYDRRVHFQENLPVYKSSENIRTDYHNDTVLTISSDDTEAAKLEYMKNFIHCLFESEPRNIGLSRRGNVLETRPSFEDDYSKMQVTPQNHHPVDSNNFQVGNKTEDENIVDITDNTVAVDEKQTLDTAQEDANTLDAISRDTDSERPSQITNISNFDQTTQEPITTNEDVHNRNEVGQIPIARHPRIVKVVSGRKQQLLSQPTDNDSSCSKANDTDLCHSTNTLCTDNTAERNNDDTCEVPPEKQESLDKISNMLAMMADESDEPKKLVRHSSVCEAELVYESNKDSVCDKDEEDGKYSPNYQGNISDNEFDPKQKKDMRTRAKEKDKDINEDSVVPYSPASDEKITRYTFTYNDDSDPDSPKIKSVTYEYITEYKLNNVKVHYKQNRKVQTDDCTQNEEGFGRSITASKQTSTIDKSETETSQIPVEEVMEKSVCYPLGPVFSIPVTSFPGSSEDQEESTVKKVSQTSFPIKKDIKHVSYVLPRETAEDSSGHAGAVGKTLLGSSDDSFHDESWKATKPEKSMVLQELPTKKFVPILGRGYLNKQESDNRPLTPEIIAQDEAPAPVEAPPMTEKERKLFAKQEKERLKREREEEKRRKKEEDKEKKRLEKERKALQAEERKAAAKMSKQKGKEKRDPEREVRERRDSKSSNDIGREWNEARSQEERGPATPDRSRKRLSSFEDIKKAADLDENDRPPTPPEPLPLDHDHKKSRSSSHSGSDNVSNAADEGEEAEEVSF